MDNINNFEKLIEKYGRYDINNPEAIMNEKSNQRKYRKINLDEEKRYNPNEDIEEIYGEQISEFNNKKFIKYYKCMQTILLKNIEKQLMNTGDFSFPKSTKIVQTVAYINKIFLKNNSVYKDKLKKGFNKETLKIRSSFKSLLSNLEKFQYKEINVKPSPKIENQIRNIFPKAELYRYLRLLWINRKLEQNNSDEISMKIGYNLMEDTLKSCIVFYPNLVCYFDETKEKAKEYVSILEGKNNAIK
ncbi:Uncharacterised protein [Campylobacter hyointestinalis subsp. hyointestinalis]|uniref:Uncharacterized protein n=1 Tax=Campylobacter hyointestinalis subsp. hyointestinalis TaxID=91352 RepID=A0A0S4SWR8_CAMHY|nr:hypothetical protein [Campylobacter hyointestinalis]CUU90710.1 Uncharacterised protein [Campylobacter hyointestinalis subsp. hyointestinalis]